MKRNCLLINLMFALLAVSLAGAQTSNELFAQTRVLEAEGKYSQACELCRRIVKLEDTYDSWLRYGWIAWQAGKTNEAANAYQRALFHVPKSMDARLGLLATLDKRRQWRRAEIQARQILDEAPGHEQARRYLAHALYRQGNFKEAAGHYHRLVKQRPGDKDMALGLGLCLRQLGQESSAQYWLSQAGHKKTRLKKANSLLAKAHIYYFSGSYSNQSYYGDFSGQQIVVEGKVNDKLGIAVHHTSSDTPNNNQGNLNKTRSGLGIFHETNNKRHLLRFTSLQGNEDFVGEGNVISFYTGEDDCGFGLDIGNYDDFSTLQLTVDFVTDLNEKTKLIISPMVQRRSGTLIDIRRYEENLESLGFTLKRTNRNNSIWAGGYFGNRWFTVEGSGLVVWNVDEEYKWGFEAGLSLGKGDFVPTFSVRYDKVDTQLGLNSDTSSLTYTVGGTIKF